MLKFPLSPKEENPWVVTMHKETASVSESPCIENEWRGKGLRANFIYACPILPWPLSGAEPWDPVQMFLQRDWHLPHHKTHLIAKLLTKSQLTIFCQASS